MDINLALTFGDVARLIVLVLVTLLAVIGAIRRSKSSRANRDLANGIFWLVVVIAMGLVSSRTSWLLSAFFVVDGVIVGILLGRVRPLIAWIAAFCQIYFTMALLWDGGGYFAAGHAVLAFAAAMALTQSFRTRNTPSSASGDAGQGHRPIEPLSPTQEPLA